MGDPELRNDEVILLRTQGIFVKSIPFEGILTNKRIILIDRATNLLPQREIPLVTIKNIEPGENAIRDQTITLSVLARTGETRQMILTFSRQTGGTRIKERNEWLRLLKENTASTFDKVVRKVVPGREQAPKKTERVAPPRIEVISSPMVKHKPATMKTAGKKEVEESLPIKRIIESHPVPVPSSTVVKEHAASPPGFGTYCSRCGNRVPEGSEFCNRCGSRIVVPDLISVTSTERTPSGLAVPPKQEIPKEQIYDVSSSDATASESVEYDFPETNQKPELLKTVITTSQISEPTIPGRPSRAPKGPGSGFSFKLGKKEIIGIVVIIVIIAIVLGGFFLYPMISGEGSITPGDSSAPTVMPTITLPQTPKPTETATYRPPPGNSAAKVGY
ncbi:MAG: zinc ribbon domain-containing protein [Methanoregula sp.]|nr:zinc ribbon domain-containing protein [Methanoregula sp.]